jgi:hypothetical protein
MIDEATLAQMNERYSCPPDAGPAWRAACDYGFDMSLVESALEMTPERRLEQHQHALNLVLEIQTARGFEDPNDSGR